LIFFKKIVLDQKYHNVVYKSISFLMDCKRRRGLGFQRVQFPAPKTPENPKTDGPTPRNLPQGRAEL
jgi:hypothetical protein